MMEEEACSSYYSFFTKPTVSEALEQISMEQIPSDEHAQKCQDIALNVIDVLEKEIGSTVSGHVMVAGSYGKGTAIAIDSDYDIVIFFNNREPPFTKLLNNMEDSIKDNAEKFKDLKWKCRSSIHVSFEIDGIQFDITPASQLDRNFCWNRWSCFAPSYQTPYPSKQYINTLKKIQSLVDPIHSSYVYSSSLSIDAVLFVQRQNDFIRSVIRLAKYWIKHVNIGKLQVRGRSLIAETLAIHACYDILPYGKARKYYDEAFFRFLELVASMHILRLYILVNYQRRDIPECVFHQTPLLLDPANPYNNLLSPTNFPPLALVCFKEAACRTARQIQAWKTRAMDDIGDFRLLLKMQERTCEKFQAPEALS